MIPCTCLVQDGQIGDETQLAIRQDLDAFAQASFGAAPAIQWLTIAEGDGFTESKPSTSVIVSLTADRALDRGRREQLLRDLSAIWIERAGKTPDEIVAVIRDPTQ